LSRLLAARGHEVLGLSRGLRRAEGAFSYQPCELTDAGAVLAAVMAAALAAVLAVVPVPIWVCRSAE